MIAAGRLLRQVAPHLAADLEADEPVSLVACHLAPGFGYQDPGASTGRYEASEPFEVSINLDALR